ncbi:MAG: formylglycine-generating enzyme family protein [Candidatus Brocadiia bacterium]
MFRQIAMFLLLACFASQTLVYAEDKGSIQVKCEPGVSITLGGVQKGVSTKESGGLAISDVAVGVHALKAWKGDLAPQFRSVTVEKDRVTEVELDAFVPKEVGSLEVRTTPVGCQIDCSNIGVLGSKKTREAWSMEDVQVGMYELILASDDKTLKTTIEIRKAFKTIVTADFAKRKISVVIEDPDQAQKKAEAMRNMIKNAPFRLVAISPGSFMMGSNKGDEQEKPVHKVKLTKAFFMSATEITQAQYKAVTETSPSFIPGDDNPVENISWQDAVDFCLKVTESERGKGHLPDGYAYRLPTEAEWEYCCRAGNTKEYCFGDDKSMFSGYGWFLTNANSLTHPVGTKKPNAWGLYDMHGNVREWCQDWFADKYPSDEQADPEGPAKGEIKVYRSGYFMSKPEGARSASRGASAPISKAVDQGIRVVAAPELAKK